ncbi:ATP-binding protein [Pricia sp.]|uniref:sensor histidine kinase n=1 Tax=Pricia sp. TaxID=2268138 RepID=UPI0035936EA8
MGKSESIGRATDQFAPVSKSLKLYSRKAGTGRFEPDATLRVQKPIDLVGKKREKIATPDTDFKKCAEAILISDYAPVSVIIDRHTEIVHINGNIEPFVAPSTGRPSHELIKTARKELAFELRNALHKAKEGPGKVRKEGIPIKTKLESYSVDLEVVPMPNLLEPYFLVLFWKNKADSGFFEKVWKKVEPVLATSQESQVQQRNTALENELEQLREDMRGISEDQEAYNEELQSANEELLSGNEEMQSLNEELETSKEELESTNEELIVVNRELIEKQDELNDSLTYSDEVIATVREPFLVLADNLHIQKANASYYRKFDVETEEVEGLHFFEVQNGLWHHEVLRSLLQKVLPEEQRIVDEELTLETDSDGELVFRFNAREIVRVRESRKLILLEISDITRRKAVERNYLTIIDELNRTNEQLDQFVHVASHDLQEPLRKITTFAGRITDKGKGISDKDLDTYLSKIMASSARMSALIKNMLDYARLAHHEQLFETTDFNTVLKDILSDFELLIEQKGAEMKIGQLPTLEAVPLQINQLFYNLVSNALKFSKEGAAPIISISSRKLSAREASGHTSLDQGLSYHEIVVRDNGIGFGKKYSQKIFAIFQRLNPSGRYLGTGIGLALCKRIAGNHHGEIYAESKGGEGAAFHILLPEARPNGA